jgi:hypothetical protein
MPLHFFAPNNFPKGETTKHTGVSPDMLETRCNVKNV